MPIGRFRYCFALALILSLGRPAVADDLRVLCIPGLKAAVDALLPDFERLSGKKVDVTYEIYTGQKQRIEAGDFDVALFAASQIHDMAQAQQADAATARDVATTSIGVA